MPRLCRRRRNSIAIDHVSEVVAADDHSGAAVRLEYEFEGLSAVAILEGEGTCGCAVRGQCPVGSSIAMRTGAFT